MSNFTLGPLPCRTGDGFTKFVKNKEICQKKERVVVHRSVEGENNGECYKIKGPKTPFILNHLERQYQAQIEEKAAEEPMEEGPTSSEGPTTSSVPKTAKKREHEVEEEEHDANQPSTSSESFKRRRRS